MTDPIHISIHPGLTPEEVQITATGHQDAPVSAEIMRDAWGIADLSVVAQRFATAWGYDDIRIGEPIWDASTLSGPAQLEPGQGGRANFARNIARTYLRLAPARSRLLQIDQEVVLADRALWDNRANPDARSFQASMSCSTSESVESSWEHSRTVGIAAEIGTSIGPVEGKVSLSYDDTWGESHGESHGKEVSFENSISGELQPGELQVAALTQQRGFATIRTDFAVSQPPYKWGDDDAQGFLVGFAATGSVIATYQGHPRVGVGHVVIELSRLLPAATAKNSRTDKIGVFADADLASYPIPDASEESIRRACGAHDLTTTYRNPDAS